MSDETTWISDAERKRRQKAVDQARNSIRLEGFILPAEVEELSQRYVAGEMTSEELSEAIQVRYVAGEAK